MESGLLETLGGEEGCRRLSADFYARVGRDETLRPLFPGKSLRCAVEEFAAFLIQFLGGDEEQTQKRWWLSLRESHGRFRIEGAHRSAWLKHMRAALEAAPISLEVREMLGRFFVHSSTYVMGKGDGGPAEGEIAERWNAQLMLDRAVKAIVEERDEEAMELAVRFASRRTVFGGLLARMMQTGRAGLIRFAVDAVERDGGLAGARFHGRTLLHHAAGAGCVEMAGALLRLGVDANVEDAGGHTPLYRVANECGTEAGVELARMLVRAGADVNAGGGVTGATPLHMCARRGYVELARVLIACGARVSEKDKKGVTPLERAIRCRQKGMVDLLRVSTATRDI